MRQWQFTALALIAAIAASGAMDGASFRASASGGTFSFCTNSGAGIFKVRGAGFTPAASLVIWTGWDASVGSGADQRLTTVSAAGSFEADFPLTELPTIVEATDDIYTPVGGPVSVGTAQPSCTIAPGPSVSTSIVTPSTAQLPADGTSTAGIAIRLKDGGGLDIPIGGEAVTVSTAGGTFAGGCTSACATLDNGNGTYSATLTVSAMPGIATITGFLNGVAIAHMGTVSVLPLAPTLGAHPPSLTPSSSATFTFTGLAGLTFQCSIDGGAFAPCSSPFVTAVGTGPHTFSVEQVEPISQLASPPTSFSWTVDPTAPAPPVITGGPSASTTSGSATFAFSGETGTTFTCSLDGAAAAPCVSGVSYNQLSPGAHTFQVFAINPVGKISAAAVYNWVFVLPPGGCNAAGSVRAIQNFTGVGAGGGSVRVHIQIDAECDLDKKSNTLSIDSKRLLVQLNPGGALVDAAAADIQSIVFAGTSATITGSYRGAFFTVTLVDSSTANTLAVTFPGFPTATSETSPRNGVRVDLS